MTLDTATDAPPALSRRGLLAAAAVAGGVALAPAPLAHAASAAGELSPTGDLPLRLSEEIQGDVLAGFRKDHVHLLLLTMTDPAAARDWLRALLPQLATTRQVASFNEKFSQSRAESGGIDPAGMSALWAGLSLSHPGLALLAGQDPLPGGAAGTAEAFRQGPAERADLLGDTGESAPEGWLFGAPGTPVVHAVLTLAADHPGKLAAALDRQRAAAGQAGIRIAFQQDGATLPGPAAGQEHFGYQDCISQPGVRGFDPAEPGRPEQVAGRPGSRLLPAGKFVVGRGRTGGRPTGLPAWALDGSFQVVRRLAQDVPGWLNQVETQLAVLKAAGAAPADAPREWLGARLVGRWPSGAPVARCPYADPGRGAARSDAERSDAARSDAARASADRTGADDFGFDFNDFGFAEDPQGWTTPLFSHLRKSNPRDGLVLQPGGRPLAAGELDAHRIIRRGLPYGPAHTPGADSGPHGPRTPRGLLFVSYQADLVDQFEFIQRRWIDDQDFPPKRTPKPGADPVLGPDGPVAFETPSGAFSSQVIPLYFHRFVRTEGALYTFTPSLTVLRRLAEGHLDTTPLSAPTQG